MRIGIIIEYPKKTSVFNLANGTTLIGIGLTFWVLEMRFGGLADWITFSVTVCAGLTDFLDGWLARKYNQVTRLGAILDRFRDKLYAMPHLAFIYLSFYSLIEKGMTIYFLLALILFISLFEVVLLTAGIWGTFKKMRVESNKWGKRKMACECLILYFWAFINDLHPLGIGLASPASLITMTILLSFSVLLTWKSLEGYYASYFGNGGVKNS